MSIEEHDFAAAADILNCHPAAIKAICQVEAPRGGFNPDGTPVTLFEGHWFHKLTKGRFGASHPSLSYPKWTRQFYGKSWKEEQARLQTAKALDFDAAVQATSWGRFQIMGFNWNQCGFKSLNEFLTAMHKDEKAQLLAFVGFIDFKGLSDELQRQDWDGFARVYNGPRYKENNYAVKLELAYKKFGGS